MAEGGHAVGTDRRPDPGPLGRRCPTDPRPPYRGTIMMPVTDDGCNGVPARPIGGDVHVDGGGAAGRAGSIDPGGGGHSDGRAFGQLLDTTDPPHVELSQSAIIL